MKTIQKKNKKIAFILPSLHGGGAEKVFINLSIVLANQNNDVTLICISNNKDYDIDLKKYNIHYLSFNKKKIIFSLLQIVKFFRKNKFDIIFSTIVHLNIAMFFLNKLFIKQKVILRESNNIKLNLKNKNFIIKLLYDFLISIAYNNSNLIVPSSKLKDNLINKYQLNENKVHVINNPISIDFNQQTKIINYKDFLKFIGINENKNFKIILNIGSLTKQKNQIQIIKAIEKMDNIENIKLIIVGKGPMKNQLLDYIKKNKLEKYVFLVGFHSQIEIFLNFASLYVCSSLWEGFPNALIDAASHNLQIISNNCDYGPSEILQNGKFGALCDINDYQKLANLIQLGLKNKLKVIPQDFLKKKYDINFIAKKYEVLLNV